MDILISIGGKIAEFTVAPVGRQVGYLLFYNINLKELTDQVEELENTRHRIIHLIEIERRDGKEIEADVQTWLHRVDEILGEAKKIHDDPNHAKLVGCSSWCLLNLQLRHQLSRKAKKKVADITDVQRKGKFDTVGYLPLPDGTSSTFATRGTSQKLGSRNTMKLDIVKALKDPKLSNIGVYGLGGVGKTTLVKEVAQKAKDGKLFDVVVMSHVSQTPNIERIQGEVADILGLHFDEMTVAGRARRLCERIKKEKTILIILDDIWKGFDLEKVGIPFGDDHKGCKLLLTSRTQDVLRDMETQKDFRLEALNGQETWSLFNDMAGEVDKDPILQHIATEVAKKCAGLPVLIVTVARALKNKGIHDWRDSLNQLARVENKEMHEITYSTLELSYNQLESDDMKTLFMLCGVMGEFCLVSDLLKYGMGLGIFKHINKIEDARSRLYKMISALKASCLLLEDKTSVNYVKMHDVVREVAISIASRDHYVFTMKRNVVLDEWPTENLLRRCPQIILDQCCIQRLPERLECPELNFLVLDSRNNRDLEIPNSFFEKMRKLQVLDLTGFNMHSLPTSIGSLTELKTLCLYACSLENMVEIGALKKLEILCLSNSSMQKLPSEIGQLTHLRMLDLSNCGIEFIPHNILYHLTKLEELYMGNITIMWEVKNSAMQNKNASLGELMHLPNLTTLEIQIREAWVLPRDLIFEKLEGYNIVIGDVWEWSDPYGTSKTLKLKLGTSIHLEHGIKTLIKRVQNLYLDEIGGISNVLYQLNGEGFPLLMHLHLQNNTNIQHIINSMEWNQAHNAFPILETLVLHSLNNLQKICHGPLVDNSFSKLRFIKVECCDRLKFLLSCSMARSLPQLTEIEVCKCNSLKNIVCRENDASDDNDMAIDKIELYQLHSLTLQQLSELDDFYSIESTSSLIDIPKYKRLASNLIIPFFSEKVELPNLKTLKLSVLKLNQIWDDDLLTTTNYMQNLTNLNLEDCGDLKHLFSLSMARNLKNLKQLQISNCRMMEEIVASDQEERDNDIVKEEVGFPKLETLIIKNMENLKNIWHYQFDGMKMLKVENCDKVMILFPSFMKGTFQSLETLVVSSCGSVEKIFELNASENRVEESTVQLRNLTLNRLPKLKQIWSEDPRGILSYNNLQVVHVEDCNCLEFLFPLSVAKGLMNLEELNILYCQILKEIVAKGEGKMEGLATFVLNRLTSLDLRNLLNLTGFYSGNYTLACPSLKFLNVFECKKLELFKTQSISCQEQHLGGKLHVSTQQPLFTIEEVIPNLETFTLNSKSARIILQHKFTGDLFRKLKHLWVSKFEDVSDFPIYFLQDIPSLEYLVVEWSSFKEIFQYEGLVDEEGQNKVSTQFKKLKLLGLAELEHICKEGSWVVPVLEALESLWVDRCSNLINLVPSVVTFSHLKYLEVTNCNGLTNLIMSSTVRSLGKLQAMKIEACDSLAEIVTEKGDETKEITFSSLEVLELICLPRLRKFSSSKCFIKFPLLEEVNVRQCPRMEIFSMGDTSTPNLRKVQITENHEDRCWQDNLNDTIKKMFSDMVAFNTFKHLTLSEYPELKDIWYDQLQGKMLNNLKSLVVQRCDFLSNVLFQSNLLQVLQNLEELEIRECDSLEAVFDMKGMAKKETHSKVFAQLRKLTLYGLPKLKHVWKEDPEGIFGYNNLQVVNVEDCQCLEYLFPLSVAKGLMNLEILNVRGCQTLKEIVAKVGEKMEGLATFVLNRLTSLDLRNLLRLTGFYSGNYTLACPSLKFLNVFECKKLELFKTQSISYQEQHLGGKLHVSTQQPLFTIEEVIPNLETFTLNSKCARIILQHKFTGGLFRKLRLLRVSQFEDESDFPIYFLQDIPSLEHLVVEWSSFKEIFQDKRLVGEEGQNKVSTQLKKLTLLGLAELQHIYKEGSWIVPVLEALESLWVDQCSNLINLSPSIITFSHLKYLEVTNCNGLTNLIMSSTARSLDKLQTIKIEACDSLAEIVIEKGDETKEDIAFSSLEVLELICLPRLSKFSSSECFIKFPLLEEVNVRQCPRMEIFSMGDTTTPNLQKVQITENHEDQYWEGNLNDTIKKMFSDMVAFDGFKHLKLSEYPELKDMWYGQLEHKIFSNLKSLVVHKCDFVSNVLLSSNLMQALQNLEELEVRDCDLLEVVFDVKGFNDKERIVAGTTQLKKLTLSSLPNLKHVWNKDPQEILSFEHLEELNVESCGVEEIVAMEEGSKEFVRFDFPQLTKLRLVFVSKLKCFYPGMHALECPSLKILNVYEYDEEWQIFAFDCSEFQQSHEVEKANIPIPHAPFSVKKICPNLKELALNGKDAMIIRKIHYQENLFQKVEFLRLQYFHETPATFSNDFLQRFPNLVNLQVRSSSFETLVPVKAIGHHYPETLTQITELWLVKLDGLKYVWNEDCESVSLGDNFETSEMNRAPSSIPFKNLTKLWVTDCKGVIYLMTSLTVKSLVQLTILGIQNCEKIENVVKIDEQEAEEEIIFENLQYLEFDSLPSFRSFCCGKQTLIFPSLEDLVVKECPQMEIFSSGVVIAPLLTTVKTENQKKRWKGDLITTIKQLFLEKRTLLHTEASSSSEVIDATNP